MSLIALFNVRAENAETQVLLTFSSLTADSYTVIWPRLQTDHSPRLGQWLRRSGAIIPLPLHAFMVNFIVEPCIDTISINSKQLMRISVFIKTH